MSNLDKREAALRAAMAKATLSEQRRLAGELNKIAAIRAQQSEQRNALNLANTTVEKSLAPVLVHGMHTAATDWLGEQVPTSYNKKELTKIARDAQVEASAWFRGVSPAVRSYQDEFAEQARGFARRTASQYGTAAKAVEEHILAHIASLYKQAEGTDAAGIESAADGETNPEVTDWADEVSIDEDGTVPTETPEDSGITPAPYDEEYLDEDNEAPGEEASEDAYSSDGTPPAVTSRRRAMRRQADRYDGTKWEGLDPSWDIMADTHRDASEFDLAGDYCVECGTVMTLGDVQQDGGYWVTEAGPWHEDCYENSSHFGSIQGRHDTNAVTRAAQRFLGSEEGTTPAQSPGEVDEEQSGEAGSTLPREVSVTDRPEYFPNFMPEMDAADASSERAKNISANARRRRAMRKVAGNEYAECQDCDWTGLESELSDWEGNCPKCGSDQIYIGDPDDFGPYESRRRTSRRRMACHVEKRGDEYVVIAGGEVRGTHDTKAEAIDQQQAIQANSSRRKAKYRFTASDLDLDEPLVDISMYYDFCPVCNNETLDRETGNCVECGYAEFGGSNPDFMAKKRAAARRRAMRRRAEMEESSEEEGENEEAETAAHEEAEVSSVEARRRSARRRKAARRFTASDLEDDDMEDLVEDLEEDSDPESEDAADLLEVLEDTAEDNLEDEIEDANEKEARRRAARRRQARRKTALNIDIDKQELMENVLYDLYYSWWHKVQWNDSASSPAIVVGEDPDGEGSIMKQVSAEDLEKALEFCINNGYYHCGASYADLDSWDACVSDTVLQVAVYGEVIFA